MTGGIALEDRARDNGNQKMSIQEALRAVEAALRSMTYGEIIIRVHDGAVVWVDRHERYRIAQGQRR